MNNYAEETATFHDSFQYQLPEEITEQNDYAEPDAGPTEAGKVPFAFLLTLFRDFMVFCPLKRSFGLMIH